MFTISTVWTAIEPTAVLVIFWAFVSLILLAPVLLVDAVFQIKKIQGIYHFRGRERHIKRQYIKEIMLHGTILLISASLVLATKLL